MVLAFWSPLRCLRCPTENGRHEALGKSKKRHEILLFQVDGVTATDRGAWDRAASAESENREIGESGTKLISHGLRAADIPKDVGRAWITSKRHGSARLH